jgi:hypothetical protein
VEYELRDIRAFYRDAQLLFGKDASLASIRMLHADLLRLALQVQFTAQRPVNGSLNLSDGITADGIADVPLGSVFSFPPSGSVVLFNLSQHLPATDRGLAAAFLVNGTTSVVLNAAPLTRKAKKAFGEGLYTSLLSGTSVPEAVRAAQISMGRSREMSATHYWAPIMVWGTGNAGEAGQR